MDYIAEGLGFGDCTQQDPNPKDAPAVMVTCRRRGHGLLPREDYKEPREWLTKRAEAEEPLSTVEAALASSPA